MIDKDVDWHFGQTMDIPLGERIAIVVAKTTNRGEEITLTGRLVFLNEIWFQNGTLVQEFISGSTLVLHLIDSGDRES
jgi:hypothetical protein